MTFGKGRTNSLHSDRVGNSPFNNPIPEKRMDDFAQSRADFFICGGECLSFTPFSAPLTWVFPNRLLSSWKYASWKKERRTCPRYRHHGGRISRNRWGGRTCGRFWKSIFHRIKQKFQKTVFDLFKKRSCSVTQQVLHTSQKIVSGCFLPSDFFERSSRFFVLFAADDACHMDEAVHRGGLYSQ